MLQEARHINVSSHIVLVCKWTEHQLTMSPHESCQLASTLYHFKLTLNIFWYLENEPLKFTPPFVQYGTFEPKPSTLV